MKLKLMLMRMADRRSRVISSISSYESETSCNGSTVDKVESTAVSDYDWLAMCSNPRNRKQSRDSLFLGTCSSPDDDMYSPTGKALSSLSADSHNPASDPRTCFLFESSSFYERPLMTCNTSNVSDFKYPTSGNHFINTNTRTGMLPMENDFPMPHFKQYATLNRSNGVFLPTRCKWEDCNEIVESDLIRHLHNAHLKGSKEGSKEGDFICRWRNCHYRGKSVKSRCKLISHIRSHTNRVFSCEICRKRFSRREALKLHLRCHTGERPYVCSFIGCKKTFKSPSDKSKHFKTHKETHPYVCKVFGCSKRYTDPSTRRKHEKTHMKDSQKTEVY